MKLTRTRLTILFIFILILPLAIFLSSTPWQGFSSLAEKAKDPQKISQPKDTQVATEPFPIHHWLTQNGISTYFVPTEGLPIVDIIVTLNAGSSRDGDKFGLSSLTASLLDEGGTQNHSPEALAKGFEDVGALFDAETDRDKLYLYLRSLSDPSILPNVVDLFSEIIGKPAFAESFVQLLKNQTLISLKKELQQPGVIASKAFLKSIYGEHPYAHPVSGNLESVSSITAQDITQFHQTYFVAENAIITIVGGLHRDQAKSLSEKIAAALPRGKKAPPLPPVSPLKEGLEDRIPFPSQQTHVVWGQPCLVPMDPDFFPLTVGNYILGEGPLVARLFKEVRDKNGLVYNITSRFKRLQQAGPFAINLQTQKENSAQAIELVKNTLDQFIKEGPTEPEVAAAKKGIIGGFPLGIGTNAQIAEVMSELAFYGLPIDFLQTFQAQVEKVTREDIHRAFEKRLDPNKMRLVVVGG